LFRSTESVLQALVWTRRAFMTALLVPPLAFLLVFFVVPLSYLLYGSLTPSSPTSLFGTGLTFAHYRDIMSDTFYVFIIERTLLVGAIVVALTLIIGYPTAMLMARLSSRGRLIMLAVMLFPLMVSNVIRAYGWVAILGRRGVVNGLLMSSGAIDVPLSLLFGVEAVALGLFTVLLPYMVISIANSLSSLDKVYAEAAASLGAGPIRTFIHVIWPLSSPGVAAGMMMTFFLMLSAYVTVTLLGGPRYKLLVSTVFDKVSAFEWPRAAAFAFILLAIAMMGGLLIELALRPGRVRGHG
jgi:putative spermidine/putrescine transport system permease protein